MKQHKAHAKVFVLFKEAKEALEEFKQRQPKVVHEEEG